MRSNHATSPPIQARKELRNEVSNNRDHSSGPALIHGEVLFSQSLPVLAALKDGHRTIPDPQILDALIRYGCVATYSPSETAEVRKKAAHVSQWTSIEKREMRNVVRLERECSLWEKLVSIPRFLSSSAIQPGFEEKLISLQKECAKAKDGLNMIRAKLAEAFDARKIIPLLVPHGAHHLALTPVGERLLQGEIYRQLEEPNLTVKRSVDRIVLVVECLKHLHQRYLAISEILMDRVELKGIWHIGDIALGLTLADGTEAEVTERFFETFLRVRNEIQGSDRSIALVSLSLSQSPGDIDRNFSLLNRIAGDLFPSRTWPIPSFLLNHAAQFVLQRAYDSSLPSQYEYLSTVITDAKWGGQIRLAGQFAAVIAANITGRPTLIVNQLSDLAESLEDMAGFRSAVEVSLASLLVLPEEGSIYRIMQRTHEARGLLNEHTNYRCGSTLVNSVLLAMLPGSIPENLAYLEGALVEHSSTSIFRADCFLLAAAYAEIEKVDRTLLPSVGASVQTSPRVIKAMCQSILSAEIAG